MNKLELIAKILIVDDEDSMCELVKEALTPFGFQCTLAHSAEEALSALVTSSYDVVLTDIKMPKVSGLELCQQIQAARPDLPVVLMTAFGTMETAIEAMRRGAYDFVTKPFELDLLRITIERAAKHHQLKQKLEFLEEQNGDSLQTKKLAGDSEAMCGLRKTIAQVAKSDASILISGESGTGKELIAQAIHHHSARSDRPFVAVNCGALSESLIESELFGHVKGAFTSANEDRTGLLRQAEGGTLFLDEIGEMPLAMQVKLLRALEENTLRPVGGNKEIHFDVRILAATHRDLELAVEKGEFREDLYYRINVIQLFAPTLRSRGSDILQLATLFLNHFAKKIGKALVGISQPAAEKLLAYSWPGNVRELRNVIERAVTLTQLNQITVEDLPPKIIKHETELVYVGGSDPDELVPLSTIENQYIQHVLKVTKQNRTSAAKILGLDRKTLYRKLKLIDGEPT